MLSASPAKKAPPIPAADSAFRLTFPRDSRRQSPPLFLPCPPSPKPQPHDAIRTVNEHFSDESQKAWEALMFYGNTFPAGERTLSFRKVAHHCVELWHPIDVDLNGNDSDYEDVF